MRKVKSKLKLNKATVDILNDNDLQHVKGGGNDEHTTSCRVCTEDRVTN